MLFYQSILNKIFFEKKKKKKKFLKKKKKKKKIRIKKNENIKS